MTKEQSIKIVDRVKTNRQNFSINESVYQEWYRVLQNYDFEDVDNSLTKYLGEEYNDGKYPTAYELTRHLTKCIEIIRVDYEMNCPICNRLMLRSQFDKHFDRCSSVDYIYRNYKKYFNKEIDKGALWKLSDVEFGQRYWKFCESLVEIPELSDLEKRTLTNAILTHYGNEPLYEIEDMTRKIGGKSD